MHITENCSFIRSMKSLDIHRESLINELIKNTKDNTNASIVL
jgi:hypothetical protein